jgi:hypothetical protein
MRLVVISLAGVVALSGAGCGGSSEEDAARDAVKEYVVAIADRDGRAACALLAREVREQFERSKATCQKAYGSFGRALNSRQRDRLKSVEPEVTVEGDEASTKIKEPPFEGELLLRREDEAWKIARAGSG